MIRAFLLRKVFGLASAFAPVLLLAQVDVPESHLPRDVTVHFEGGSAAAEYAHVVVALTDAGLLEYEPYVDRAGQTPAAILAKSHRLIESVVPPELDRLLCRLNRHICTLTTLKSGSGATAWRNLAAPQGQPVAVSCDAGIELRPSYEICIPRLTLLRYPAKQQRPFNPDIEDLATIVVQNTRGCERFDAACEAVIRKLNPGLRGDLRRPLNVASSTITVPVGGYALRLPIASEEQFHRLVSVLDTTVVAAGDTTHGISNKHVYYTVPARAVSESAAVEDGEAATPAAEPADPLSVMHYPADRIALDARSWAPVVVGVWDRHVDDLHCAFAGPPKVVVHADPLPFDPERDPRRSVRGKCGDPRKPGDSLYEKWDHGTHVAGIIAGSAKDGRLPGVNPKARLWPYEVNPNGFEAPADPILNVEVGEPPLTPKVINISQEWIESGASPSQLRRFLMGGLSVGYSHDILFVASAGNEKHRIPEEMQCTIVPACWSTDRVNGSGIISVVALNHTGTARWESPPDCVARNDPDASTCKASNVGLGFDVAAVGDAFSSLDGNSFGAMEGTSMAAAYVSGLASLIYSKAAGKFGLTPGTVKNRILYTADFLPELDALVHYGRINFTRALQFDVDSLTTDIAVPPTVDAFVKDESFRVFSGLCDCGEPILPGTMLQMSQIRRISADREADIAADHKADTVRYWVVVEKAGRLSKYSDVRFDSDAVIRYKVKSREVAVPLSNVLDYVCALTAE